MFGALNNFDFFQTNSTETTRNTKFIRKIIKIDQNLLPFDE